MGKRKIVSWLLLGAMVTNLAPIKIFADAQYQVTKLFAHSVGHTKKLDGSIQPDIRLEWEMPPLGEQGHKAEYFQFEAYDMLGDNKKQLSEVLKVDMKQSTFSDNMGDYYYGADNKGNIGEDSFRLKNGTLYKISVTPRHINRVANSNGTITTSIAPETGIKEFQYVITDFNTEMRESLGKLDVLWEYIEGATYELVYIEADNDTKGEIIGASAGDTPKIVKTITDEDAKKMLYNKNGKTQVKYTINDTKSGQIYSAYVEVKNLKNSKFSGSFSEIKINKETDIDGPKVVKGITEITLTTEDVNSDLIKLKWSNNSWSVLSDTLKKIVVYGQAECTNEFKLLASKNNDNSATIESIIIDRPKVNTTYYIEFVFETDDGTEYVIKSKDILYSLNDLRYPPLKPIVPKTWYNNIVEYSNLKDYLVTGDDISSDDIDLANRTFTALYDNGNKIQLVWDIQKKPNTDSVDYDLLYDIWVLDNDSDMSNLNNIEPLYKDFKIDVDDYDNIIYSKKHNKHIGNRIIIDKYLNKKGEEANLDANKTYYLAIQAKRPYGDRVEKSVIEHLEITMDKNGNIHTPQSIGKPPLSVVDITDTSVKVGWMTTWYEILAKDLSYFTEDEKLLAEIGSSKVYVNTSYDTPIKYTNTDKGYEVTLKNKDIIDKLIKDVGLERYSKIYYDRMMNLEDDVKYEFKYITYSQVMGSLKGKTIDEWIINSESKNNNGWSDIEPLKDIDKDKVEILTHEIKGLAPNTKYVVLMRAYRITADGTKLIQTYPSYIMCTTNNNFIGDKPIPTVPILSLDSTQDTSVTVSWEYSEDFEYELVYGREYSIDKAKKVEFDVSNLETGATAKVEIDGLFMDTVYNVWLRAKQKDGDKVSSWSNPVRAKTKDIIAPSSPKGLGVVSKQSLDELNLDFKPVTFDEITVEWNKDVNDLEQDKDSKVNKSYKYLLEMSDNKEFSECTSITTSDEDKNNSKDFEVIAKNIVKFSGLLSNKTYYFRVKTIVTVEDSESDRKVSKESDYSNITTIKTEASDNEYDSGGNNNVVTFDSDIKENYSNRVWTKKYLNTQGIISRIVKSKYYFFDIDMEKYDDNSSTSERIVIIPQQIIQTLSNKHMGIRVVTSAGKYEIPAKALDTYIGNSTKPIQITLTELMAYDIKSIVTGYPYDFSNGERLQIKSDGKTPLKLLDIPMKVSQKMVTNGDKPNNTDCYVYSDKWQKYESNVTIDKDKRYLTFETKQIGLYGKYTLKDYGIQVSTKEVNAIRDRYGIEGIGLYYNKNTKIDSNKYINIMLGIAKDSDFIKMDKTLLSEDIAKAVNSGIIAKYTKDITSEQAINGIVKLYEIKNGYRIDSKGLNKAIDIGLIERIDSKTLKESPTLHTLCSWLYKAGF